MKKLAIMGLALMCLILMAFPAAAEPWKVLKGNAVIRQDEVVAGDLFFYGEYLEVAGEVRGDVLVMAGEVNVSGVIDGNFLGIVGKQLTVGGQIRGDLRALAHQMVVEGTVAETVTAAAVMTEISSTALVGEGLWGVFQQIALAGTVDGPAWISGYAATEISGKINGDLQVRGVPVRWMETAEIAGDVDDYSGVTDTEQGKNARISGEYRIHQDNELVLKVIKSLLLFNLMWLLGSLLVGMIGYKLFPQTCWRISEPSVAHFRRYLLVGLASALGTPLVIVLLVISRVGIPLAVLLTLFYLILLFFSSIPLYLGVGRILFAKFRPDIRRHPVLLILSGGLVVALLGLIPFVGYFVQLIGFGMVVGNIRMEREDQSQPGMQV